jgi:hypothetical protein
MSLDIKRKHFQCTFGDNMSVIHVLIKQIFRAAEKAPPPPLRPHRAVQGVGWKWLFLTRSREFGNGFEAVRIRVNLLFLSYDIYDCSVKNGWCYTVYGSVVSAIKAGRE